MYSAPITLGTKAQRQPYIRVGSESIVAREYRNRRIGDFLKELQLTEGRGTGFPAIYDALEANGSPKPVFETDDDSTYFLATIPAHILADQTFIKPNINLDIKLSFNTIAGITLEQSLYLQPRGNATRAQAATVLTRYYAQ